MVFLVLGIIGIFMGVSASLFGFGGGVIVVPVLYHLLGAHNNPFSMHIAVATSSAIMIINSINTTYKQHKLNNIIWPLVFQLILYIAIGAAVGVYLTKFMSSNMIKWVFVIYMAYTIIDCIVNKNFVNNSRTEIKSINRYMNLILGIAIGMVSSIIGVGGSVLTVPLMRKLGAKMRNAVAMANPLIFPVALVAAIGYILMAHLQHISLGHHYVGFIYLPALLFLTIGGFIGVPIGAKLVNKIPDTIHAKIYILLLILVLVIMLI